MGFVTANQLINSHTPHKHIHNPKKQDYFEIINIILLKWQNQINQNTYNRAPDY